MKNLMIRSMIGYMFNIGLVCLGVASAYLIGDYISQHISIWDIVK
jgi:hypothetical protein